MKKTLHTFKQTMRNSITIVIIRNYQCYNCYYPFSHVLLAVQKS